MCIVGCPQPPAQFSLVVHRAASVASSGFCTSSHWYTRLLTTVPPVWLDLRPVFLTLLAPLVHLASLREKSCLKALKSFRNTTVLSFLRQYHAWDTFYQFFRFIFLLKFGFLLRPYQPVASRLTVMLGHQFAYSAAPVRKVKEVQFGILSPEEIVCRLLFLKVHS